MPVLQRLAILGVILGAIISTITGMNALAGTNSGSPAADSAISSFQLNGQVSSNVYQQQVVALWANKDLLKVVADETHNANSIARISTVLSSTTNWLLICLILVLISISMERRSKRDADPTPNPVASGAETAYSELNATPNLLASGAETASSVLDVSPTKVATGKEGIVIARIAKVLLVSFVVVVAIFWSSQGR